MNRIQVVALLLALLTTASCGRRQQPAPGSNASGESAEATESAEVQQTAAAGEDHPLGEFDAVTPEEVALYLQVMKSAAVRVKNFTPEDRQALNQLHRLGQGGAPQGQIPTPEQMASIQRAGELMTIDATVAREMGVSKRFSSIQSRVDRYLRPSFGASGDDEPMTAEERARVRERIIKFRELDRQDAAVLAPHRAELESLEKQVRSVLQP